ncbi:hypothetical protein Celaphus_00000854 [Cervus elaphus hippelaphus]|uniref:Clu domain-containing protein n=1 Tax=Cervus elaphus hippelaphus TaxID=46360 RepID=A0A212DAL7_CEREH|nr:hypothetical protein Celaphus_00000854 [Cervus elaphus hippelaphus]
MVIKTDELPAAAPADSAREPSPQAGGKGRPGAAAVLLADLEQDARQGECALPRAAPAGLAPLKPEANQSSSPGLTSCMGARLEAQPGTRDTGSAGPEPQSGGPRCHGGPVSPEPRRVRRPTTPELPSVMLLNGDCPESLKKEEGAAEPPRENGLDENEPGEETTGQEVIVIQDTGFSVKILAPGIEPFSLQVSPQEMVQEIHQVLMDREDTCHRTCFSLHLDGNMLDHFSELRNSGKRKKGLEMDPIDCTPPEYILPGSRERPLCPLQPQNRDWKPLQCLKVLTMSGWNPPPGNRRMHGDLMYLFVITAEDRQVSITASTRGFYLNQSTAYHFNPKPASPRFLSHSLVELLNQISPTFKKNFAALQKKRVQRHPFERIATPFQVYSWTAPQAEHAMDCVRAEDAYTSRLGYEEHIPGQTRDWNEELQTTRELPRKNLPERLLRERAIFKVHSDFTAAATRGAMAVIDGNVMAINPSEETKMQMFIWNNIFFSLGFDVRDHYKDFGGDVAAYVAPTNDLNGVRTYNAVDVEGLYTLGTVVVDYRGYRVTAQSIIPGILERDQEQSVIYGSIDFGKTVVSHPRYLELLERTSRPLKILRHRVLNDRDEEVELCSSVECKGIIGNDGRHYILDLLRTFPPDLNFLPVPGEALPEECTRAGFPRAHRHKLCCLRQELVDAFVEHSHHLVARVYESKAEFRSALQHEKEGYTIYKTQLGEDHEKTKESSEYLKCLTQQAVALQRTMNEIYRNGSSANIPPLKFTAPSMASVLEQLNVINGILFIPLSLLVVF